jgi:hypothetical protein
MTDTRMFAFESDFVASLRCVPMAVRLKLDRCGIKLTLRQWSRFTREDRQRLLLAACATPREIAEYHRELTALVALRTGEVAKPLADTPCGQWEVAYRLPAVVADYARSIGFAPPTLGQWAALSPLQRFALIKLTRDNHDNVNFVPAMREFGLVRPPLATADLRLCEERFAESARNSGALVCDRGRRARATSAQGDRPTDREPGHPRAFEGAGPRTDRRRRSVAAAALKIRQHFSR